MGLNGIHVWTHDSIGLGEDGPTHQPIEHLASLRIIPNFTLLRPCDANETAEAWKVAITHREGPVGLALTRQNLPTLDRTKYAPAEGLRRGAYILAESAKKSDYLSNSLAWATVFSTVSPNFSYKTSKGAEAPK